jgi:hypothetical protein
MKNDDDVQTSLFIGSEDGSDDDSSNSGCFHRIVNNTLTNSLISIGHDDVDASLLLSSHSIPQKTKETKNYNFFTDVYSSHFSSHPSIKNTILPPSHKPKVFQPPLQPGKKLEIEKKKKKKE